MCSTTYPSVVVQSVVPRSSKLFGHLDKDKGEGNSLFPWREVGGKITNKDSYYHPHVSITVTVSTHA